MSPLFAKKEFAPQYPVSLVRQITQFLTEAIIEGKLKSGQRLVENELQREFGVSRAPIREAFRILEKNWLLMTVPRRGTFVREVTKKSIEENIPIRASLDSLAARLALSHLKAEDIKKMKLAFLGMTGAAKKKNFKSFYKYHYEFHEIYTIATENDTLIEILRNVRRQTTSFRFSYLFWTENSFEYAIRVHREILRYFIKKNADRLEALIKEHIMISLGQFMQFLESESGKKIEE